ncbi:MAG: transposase [Desulfobacterales bacterium]
MNTDQLRARFPDESACRQFFESIIWQNGRVCPNCACEKSYPIREKTSRPGLYECDECK